MQLHCESWELLGEDKSGFQYECCCWVAGGCLWANHFSVSISIPVNTMRILSPSSHGYDVVQVKRMWSPLQTQVAWPCESVWMPVRPGVGWKWWLGLSAFDQGDGLAKHFRKHYLILDTTQNFLPVVSFDLGEKRNSPQISQSKIASWWLQLKCSCWQALCMWCLIWDSQQPF